MTDYAKNARETDSKMRKKGGPVTLRQVIMGEDDPDTGKPQRDVFDYTSHGVKFDYEARRIDGTLVQTGDQELLMSPLQSSGQNMPRPTTGDEMLVNGATFSIVNVGVLEPVDVVVLYTLQLRGN